MVKSSKLDFRGQSVFSGIDVHKKDWKVSVCSSCGEFSTFSQPPEPDKLAHYLKQNFPGAHYIAVYEAGFCGYWIHDQLTKEGIECLVANPADIPTRDKERKNKRDRVDCRKLARALAHREIEGIYVPPRAKLEDRTLIRTRQSMVRKQTRCKNQIKGMLFFYGITIPDQQEMGHWTKRFIRWLETISMERDSGKVALKTHLEELCHLRSMIAELDRAILKLARTEEYRPMVQLLKSVPGISTLTAMILLSEVVDLVRFPSLDELCAYIGLIPTTHASGQKEHVGGMTPRHHTHLRWLLIEASWVAVRKDPALLMAFQQYCKRMRKTKAIVKIARKLLNRIRYVMKTHMEYVPCVIE